MEALKPKFDELFEQAANYPDPEMQQRLSRLVGLDTEKEQLSKILGLLVNSTGLLDWAKKYHPDARRITDIVLRRPPLIVLAGDVGSGKSELASTIGDAVARQEKIAVTLLPLSLSTRGQGRVGQMTQLISTAFEYTIEKAKKLQSEKGKTRGAVILLVDEADALAQSRENNQMHHEDKAGVNAFIRGIDSLGNGKLPAAVIMCTNRPNALDPAIKRRAADIFYFKRPDKTQRFAVLEAPLTELGFSDAEIKEIADITGPRDGREYGFTFSDLAQRLLPSVILDAYPSEAVSFVRAREITSKMHPTSIFTET
jgi:SpoVK/Ycf46/Vps4 family AAA+-type ATPase